MSTDEIINMAFELGSAIAESEEINSLKEMQGRLSEDQIASDLIKSYQEARSKNDSKLRNGQIITPDEKNHLDILQQQVNDNPIVQELVKVQERFNDLMQGVYYAISQSIKGDECSSDCSSCGGGCGM